MFFMLQICHMIKLKLSKVIILLLRASLFWRLWLEPGGLWILCDNNIHSKIGFGPGWIRGFFLPVDVRFMETQAREGDRLEKNTRRVWLSRLIRFLSAFVSREAVKIFVHQVLPDFFRYLQEASRRSGVRNNNLGRSLSNIEL